MPSEPATNPLVPVPVKALALLEPAPAAATPADIADILAGLSVADRPVGELPALPAPGRRHRWAWLRKRRRLLPIAALVLVVGATTVWLLGPVSDGRDMAAWSNAAGQDNIPAYRAYLAAWPAGFYRDQAAGRIAALKSEAEDAFAHAQAANSPAAYESFLATYGKQSVDVRQARAADDVLRAEDDKAKAAFDAAAGAHTPQSYRLFLADFGASAYAADARQRLAACHMETEDIARVQNMQVSESADGHGESSSEACDVARDRAAARVENSCRESQGHIGRLRIVTARPESDGLADGVILGSIEGALTGSREASWECREVISAKCQIPTRGLERAEVCP